MTIIQHKLQVDLTNRIINAPVFSQNPPNKLALSDNVLSYFNTKYKKWCIIPLSILIYKPLIYDVFSEIIAGVEHNIDVTIIFCPFSCTSFILAGKYTLMDYLIGDVIVISGPDGITPLLSHKNTRRFEVDLSSFRDAISNHPDCQYLQQNITGTPLIDISYYTSRKTFSNIDIKNDKLHPKTLVRLIQYNSSKTGTIKYSIIVGKDATSNTPSGFNLKKNGILQYIEHTEDKIRDRIGFILPIYWFAWQQFYPTAKIIYLHSL